MADSVLDLLAEINDGGTTIIMVTHELTLADRAKRNIFVRDGEIHEGPPELHFAAAAMRQAGAESVLALAAARTPDPDETRHQQRSMQASTTAWCRDQLE